MSTRDQHDPVDPFVVVDDGDTVWRFERAFLSSRWTCSWGNGCPGIASIAAPELGRGCCSLGADLDPDEAMNIDALAATLSPAAFQFHDHATHHGVFADGRRASTAVVDGACIFLNRPGFHGGAGCALHIAALAAEESPIDWKPSVCWQLPIKVDWVMGDDGVETATVRRWERGDWGDDAASMGWWCTEDLDRAGGDRPVVESLADELATVVGTSVFIRVREQLTSPCEDAS